MSWFNQTATLWNYSGADSVGDAQFDAPTQISVRWEQRDMEYFDEDGRSRRSLAVVYLQQDVKMGDFLFLGTSAAVDPRAVAEAYEVNSFRKIPNSTATDFERRAFV